MLQQQYATRTTCDTPINMLVIMFVFFIRENQRQVPGVYNNLRTLLNQLIRGNHIYHVRFKAR